MALSLLTAAVCQCLEQPSTCAGARQQDLRAHNLARPHDWQKHTWQEVSSLRAEWKVLCVCTDLPLAAKLHDIADIASCL